MYLEAGEICCPICKSPSNFNLIIAPPQNLQTQAALQKISIKTFFESESKLQFIGEELAEQTMKMIRTFSEVAIKQILKTKLARTSLGLKELNEKKIKEEFLRNRLKHIVEYSEVIGVHCFFSKFAITYHHLYEATVISIQIFNRQKGAELDLLLKTKKEKLLNSFLKVLKEKNLLESKLEVLGISCLFYLV